jgi:hypothetical protein
MSLLSEFLSLTPNLNVDGSIQRINFNNKGLLNSNLADLGIYNAFVPLLNVPSISYFSFLNNSLSGFKFNHTTTNEQTIGNLSLISINGVSTPIELFNFDEQSDSFNFLKKVNLAEIGLNGDLSLNSNKIIDLGDPFLLNDATNKGYVDNTLDALNNALTSYIDNHKWLSADITDFNTTISGYNYATKTYVDSHTWLSSQITDFNTAVRSNKPTDLALITSFFNANNQNIRNLAYPVNDADAVNKNYADNATINSQRLSGYPNDIYKYLNGSGGWTIPQLADVNIANLIYRLSINNNSTSATNTEIMFKKAGSDRLAIGTNNSVNGSYLMAYGSPLKIGVDDIIGVVLDANANWDYGNKDLATTGTINAKTGTLRANNIGTFNSVALVSENQIDMSNHNIINVATPVNDNDGANKLYVDSQGKSITTIIQGSNTTGRQLITFVYNVTSTISSGILTPISLPTDYRNSANVILSLTVLNAVDADNMRAAYGSYSTTKSLSYGMDTTGRYVKFKCTSANIEAGSIVTALILGVV